MKRRSGEESNSDTNKSSSYCTTTNISAPQAKIYGDFSVTLPFSGFPIATCIPQPQHRLSDTIAPSAPNTTLLSTPPDSTPHHHSQARLRAKKEDVKTQPHRQYPSLACSDILHKQPTSLLPNSGLGRTCTTELGLVCGNRWGKRSYPLSPAIDFVSRKADIWTQSCKVVYTYTSPTLQHIMPYTQRFGERVKLLIYIDRCWSASYHMYSRSLPHIHCV